MAIKKISALFILLILGNNVILNYAFVLEREKEIVFLQRSRLHAMLDTRAVLFFLPQGNVLWKHSITYLKACASLKCCNTCVGKKPFLRGVLSGPVEIDGFQSHPRHSSLSPQTSDVWKEEYASMSNIHPWL